MTGKIYCRVPSHWLDDPSLCWFEWQTLITGFLALAIGAATIWMIRRQISQQDELNHRNRASRFAVAKAKSPIAAIEVAEHARAYLDAALELLTLVDGRDREAFRFDGPAFPVKAEKYSMP